MEFNNILYIIGAVIYLIYTGNKELKKHRENRPGQEPKADKKSWQNDIEDMMKKVLQGETPNPVQEPVQEAKPVVKKAKVHRHEDDFLSHEREEYLRMKKAEELRHAKSEAYSVERDNSPLSQHVTMPEVKREEEEPSYASTLVYEDGFDARKAFVYSEVFQRRGGRR